MQKHQTCDFQALEIERLKKEIDYTKKCIEICKCWINTKDFLPPAVPGDGILVAVPTNKGKNIIFELVYKQEDENWHFVINDKIFDISKCTAWMPICDRDWLPYGLSELKQLQEEQEELQNTIVTA